MDWNPTQGPIPTQCSRDMLGSDENTNEQVKNESICLGLVFCVWAHNSVKQVNFNIVRSWTSILPYIPNTPKWQRQAVDEEVLNGN